MYLEQEYNKFPFLLRFVCQNSSKQDCPGHKYQKYASQDSSMYYHPRYQFSPSVCASHIICCWAKSFVIPLIHNPS
uniref:Uncharacterized protein MANES_06G174700 n=1 Tax=Rhizophora mucronata TaxID=61149 RepID=A0A2P2MEA5_RHIMU